MAGYFAFPPSGPPPIPVHQPIVCPDFTSAGPSSQSHAEETRRRWEDKQKRDAEARLRKLERVREEALQGEMDWVSAGGWLRDPYGRKDVARTEEVRVLARVRDEERRVIRRWDAYEARWFALLSSTSPVTFVDIPWPVDGSPTSVSHLAADAVADFFLASLRTRANTVSSKDRIRSSLLRWHPDKLSSVTARTVEQDSSAVRDGVNFVFRVLRSMQDLERYPHGRA